MRGIVIHSASVLLVASLAFLPAGASGQSCSSGCIGCEGEEWGGDWYHMTSSTEILWGCVNEEQEDAHGNNHGCTSEPHENLCLAKCIESHGVCDPGEEEQVALLEAIQASDIDRTRALLLILQAPVRWDENRSALQVHSRCSSKVVLHVPVRGRMARWLASLPL
jgi:hypothetical protein